MIELEFVVGKLDTLAVLSVVEVFDVLDMLDMRDETDAVVAFGKEGAAFVTPNNNNESAMRDAIFNITLL